MEKIFSKPPSFYRMDLHAGNLLYFSHAEDVAENEYITLTMKDIIMKVDELIEAYNDLSARAIQINAEIDATLKTLQKSADDLTVLESPEENT